MRAAAVAIIVASGFSAAFAVGCGPPAIREGVFRCATSADCPPGLACAADGLCRHGDGGVAALCNWVRGGTVPPLPAACMPRCNRDTGVEAMGCGTDIACRDTALRGDPTPALAWSVDGTPSATPLTCRDCFILQQASCAVVRCPSETVAWLNCTGTCTAETSALNACVAGDSGYTACASARVTPCFAP